MSLKPCLTYRLAPAILALAGCSDLFQDPPARFLIGVANDQAYVQHFDAWSGFTTLPSTLWRVNAQTGATEMLVNATTQYDLQANADYYAAERPTPDGNGGRVIAVEIATGAEITVLERNVVLGGRYDRAFVLAGGRVIARTDEGLLVYDLDARTLAREIAIDKPVAEIETAGTDWAAVTLRNVFSEYQAIVNLATGEVKAAPALPNNAHGYYFGGAIVGDELLIAGFANSGAIPASPAVLVLNMNALTWKTLAEYGGQDDTFVPEFLYVVGADETHVLIQAFKPLVGIRLELLDRAADERTTLARNMGWMAETYCARFDAGAAYWIDGATGELVRYDVATKSRHAVSLDEVAP